MKSAMRQLYEESAARVTTLLLCIGVALACAIPAAAQAPAWAKGAGGIGDDRGYAIAADAAGNSYVTGQFMNTVTFGPGATRTAAGGRDIFVAKYDSAGTLLWVQQAWGLGDGFNYGLGIAVDGAGNSYVTGYFDGALGTFPIPPTALTPASTLSSPSLGGAFVAKYDTNGTLVWVRLIADGGFGHGIAVDAANGVYVTGGFVGTADLGNGKVIHADVNGSNDVYVAKYDGVSGIAQWATAAGGLGDEQGLGIAVAGTGVYVTGAFSGSATFGADTLVATTGMDLFVAKFDSGGVPVWARRAGGTVTSAGLAIRVDGSGNSYVSGGFGVMPNGAFGRVAKYDNNGNQVWVAPVSGNFFGYGIALDAAGNSYVTGTYFGDIAFYPPYPPSSNVPVLTRTPPTWDNRLFVAKFDNAGNLKSLQEAFGAGRAWGQGIAVAAGNSYVTGFFDGTVSFSSVPPLTSTGDFDIVRAKLSSGASGVTHFAISAPSSVAAGSPFSFTVTALDAADNPVPGYAGIVHFSSSDGNATLPANTALTAGGGMFSATLKTSGNQTITVTDTSVGSVAGTSGSIAVGAGGATHFGFSNVPATVQAGTPFSFIVRALDAIGNVDINFAGAISVISNFTFGPFSAVLLSPGEWTVTGTLLYAGPHTLSIASPLLPGTATITCAAGPATKLRVSAPLSATAGIKFDFFVTPLDAYNNPAVGYAGTVRFTSTDPGAILPADAPIPSISAPFPAILNTAGPQKIIATDIAKSTITGEFNAVSVSGFAAPTPAGNNVTVQPIDPATGLVQPISVTFASVAAPGGGTIAAPSSAIPPPANFSLKGTTYDITTTAGYKPPVTVCFTGSFTIADWILHYESGALVQLPNRQLSPAGPGPYTTICADATSLSPFGVFTAQSNGLAFRGFFRPIDMSTPNQVVWNAINAGQAVPVKWNVTLNGAPVSDPASFAGLWSYPVSCFSGAGSIGDAVAQTAPGASGLTYNGGGNWQLNWKTLQSYWNSCRAMVVKFSDGTVSPAAFFRFRYAAQMEKPMPGRTVESGDARLAWRGQTGS